MESHTILLSPPNKRTQNEVLPGKKMKVEFIHWTEGSCQFCTEGCSFTQIQWNQLKQHKKNPSPSPATKYRRVKSATIFLRHLFKTENLFDALETLITEANLVDKIKSSCEKKLEATGIINPPPKFDDVFQWFMNAGIPEAEWNNTKKVFQVDNISLYQIRKKKKEFSNQLPIKICPHNPHENVHFPLKEYIQWDLEKYPVVEDDVVIKIAFDGGFCDANEPRLDPNSFGRNFYFHFYCFYCF